MPSVMTRGASLARSWARCGTLRAAQPLRRLSTQPAEEPPLLPAPIPSLATATFDFRDPLNLSASLTEDEQLIYESAR
eukprot:2922402-Prymnesium_polylepis.1